ncbi:MAG TPA: PQQ-dependent sugar dehydrogenase [Halomonas sp.]|nr:PQQ-dependent sugar dehydrogenase [Halomonas sp.]
MPTAIRSTLAIVLALPLALTLWSMATPAIAEQRIASQDYDLTLTKVAGGLRHPWGMAQLPDGSWLISERGGQLVRVALHGQLQRWPLGLELSTRGQGGLLDIALHPHFVLKESGRHSWLYLTFSHAKAGGSATALGRLRLRGGQPGRVERLFTQNRYSAPGRHYGSRLAWLDDGSLLMSIGERGMPDRAQDGGDHAGSIVRLDENGGIPADNPFVTDDQVDDAIFSLGHRNPQGLIVAEDGRIWSTEHGPRTGDELNLIKPGANYGWPLVSRGRDYVTNLSIGRDHAPGMRDPVYVFEGRYAPSGLAEVTGQRLAAWRGDLLAGGLRSGQLTRLAVNEGALVEREVILDGEIGRIRNVQQGQDGALYLLQDAPDAGLYRLAPAQ